jgi:signal transduction histidine kinase
MTNLRPMRKPVFLWQAGLILLPVVIMATVAITAIIRTRADVEREARGRAEEVARRYSKELERPWGSLLMLHDKYSQRWSDHLVNVDGAWPGWRLVPTPEAMARLRAEYPNRWLAEFDAQFPGLRVAAVIPDRLMLGGQGDLPRQPDAVPQPPAWFTSLSAPQRAAWDSLKAVLPSGAGTNEIQQRLAHFQETKPGPEAQTNAAFIDLRCRLATLPPQEAVAEALRYARQNKDAISDAGLPLANLAFAEALRYARTTGPSESLWQAIPDQVLRAPSLLIPPLLDQLQAVAGTNLLLQDSMRAWRTLWNNQLILYDMAQFLRQTSTPQNGATTNLWIDRDQIRFLFILNPDFNPSRQATNGKDQSTDALDTEVRFIPKSVAERALARALEETQVKLPDYLGIATWLEGEPLRVPSRCSAARGTNSAPVLLAEATGRLSDPKRLQQVPQGPELDWENLPSHPRFMLRIYLADQALLFASYRRQALLLTGLVAAAAFGALVGVFASWRAFQRQLRLNELKSNFVSSVSHELRAPIASVRLMAESLERGKVPETAKQREYFSFIVQECRRLSSLIENVLDFSRIEQGRKQYDLEPTDLVALAQQTVKLMETYAAERGVNLRLQIPNAINHHLTNSQLPDYQLPADGKALQQALINLIDNALKHSPKGDTVTVGLEARSPKSEVRSPESAMGNQVSEPTTVLHVSRFTFHASPLLLWVEDHGEGIPPSEHEKIFERFYRRGSELRRQTQGVGIGLSIVKHIVEAHGGRVLVRSAPGQGSRFTIELPLNHSEDAKTQSRET